MAWEIQVLDLLDNESSASTTLQVQALLSTQLHLYSFTAWETQVLDLLDNESSASASTSSA